ncbi:MAG: cytochrome c oxidase assembly protein [Porticoccaceae bacterium]|nr:cytochrome c oxidase assembly protein [Porticoccaceae bacterium]
MGESTVHRGVLVKSLIGAVLMFMFAIFVLPPLYDLFCEITGIGGKTAGAYTATDIKVDTSRQVEVQFVATNNATMPWDFYPVEHKVLVHPGESREIVFYAKNLTGKDMVGQAIPNVLPNNAADYFHKTECFCFNNQPLAAGDEADLAVVFIIDPDLPASVNTVTLSYTIFDITDRVSTQVSQLQ